ncbi:hypothetical protein SDD30_13615 [Moorella naiadis]|uniref:hypothetical protein n=1 Tax=Moorella naiadis (nom. illeg.) TaxID=3093670 RepID=UPI003D9CB648
MDEIARVADKLIAAYNQEKDLVKAWQHKLEEQLQAIEAGAWDDLNNLLAAALPWREKLSLARQTTRQLENLLAAASGSAAPDWEDADLPPVTHRELTATARNLYLIWETCRPLQETSAIKMQQALARVRAEMEQVQTARQVARAYHREKRVAPRCLDRQL